LTERNGRPASPSEARRQFQVPSATAIPQSVATRTIAPDSEIVISQASASCRQEPPALEMNALAQVSPPSVLRQMPAPLCVLKSWSAVAIRIRGSAP
jgi:hypothetical protein